MKDFFSNPWIIGIGSSVIVLVVVTFWNRIVLIVRSVPNRLALGVPRQTLRVVPDVGNNDWSSGTIAGQHCIFANARMIVTSISKLPTRIVKVRLDELNVEGPVVVVRSGGSPVTLSRWQSVEAMALFVVKPPPVKIGEDLIVTLVVTDNFDNQHRIKGYRFRSIDEFKVPG